MSLPGQRALRTEGGCVRPRLRLCLRAWSGCRPHSPRRVPPRGRDLSRRSPGPSGCDRSPRSRPAGALRVHPSSPTPRGPGGLSGRACAGRLVGTLRTRTCPGLHRPIRGPGAEGSQGRGWNQRRSRPGAPWSRSLWTLVGKGGRTRRGNGPLPHAVEAKAAGSGTAVVRRPRSGRGRGRQVLGGAWAGGTGPGGGDAHPSPKV